MNVSLSPTCSLITSVNEIYIWTFENYSIIVGLINWWHNCVEGMLIWTGKIHEQVTLVPLAWISLYRFPMHVSLPFFIEKQLNVLQWYSLIISFKRFLQLLHFPISARSLLIFEKSIPFICIGFNILVCIKWLIVRLINISFFALLRLAYM